MPEACWEEKGQERYRGYSMSERKIKLCSLREAVDSIPDGARIGFGGFAVYQKPMAVVHEMIRAGKKDLTIVGAVNSIEADMLIGAGCVSRIETSYVGLEKFGLAMNYRRQVQAGKLKVVHYPEMLAWDRFRANREALEFWPVSFLGGSDIVNKNPEIKTFANPMTGKTMYAVPAANIDVAIIHAYASDVYGNVRLQDRHLLPQSMDVAISRSCRHIIVTVEKLVSTEEIKKTPHLTAIPAFRTTHLAEVPSGSHPTPVLQVNRTDEDFFRQYVEMSATEESFKRFLDKYIYGTKDFAEYLDLVGRDHILSLQEQGGKA